MNKASVHILKTTTGFGLAAWLVMPALSGYAQTPEAPASGATAPAAAATNLSPGAAEVVRLATSGVGDDVVLAYIKNSQALFNLSADDVLYLKDIGLSAEVTSAMLTHDTSLRGQQEQYAPAAPTPAPAAPASLTAPAPSGALTVAAAPAPVYVSSPPPDVAYFYNDLAPYGTWVQLDGYGWCWQPTAVVMTRGWRPYAHGGHWVYSDLGWYWQSTYSWGWAPFHYGRWYSHPRCGWVWTPDRVWGPAWVTWRTTGDYCGWAPLPPRAEFDVRLGWRYNGMSVGVGFDFGLGSDAFLFVGFGNVWSHDIHRHCLPPARVGPMFHQTVVINNYAMNNNRIEHRGMPIDRVSAVSRGPVPRATVRDWSARPNQMPTRAGSVVYRPRLDAPARPGNMVAQRLDAQNPAIRHAPGPVPRNERSPAFSRGGAAPVGAGGRTALESPKVSPWTIGMKGAPASRGQSAWSPAQTAPAGKARTTSDWSSGGKPASSPQMQSAPGARPTTPAMPSGRAPQSSTFSGSTRVASSSQVQSAPSASQSVRTVPASSTASRTPEQWKQGSRFAPGNRSDTGLPASYNSRSAAQSSPAASASANTRVYQSGSRTQAVGARSQPSSSSRSSTSPSSPSRGSGSSSKHP